MLGYLKLLLWRLGFNVLLGLEVCRLRVEALRFEGWAWVWRTFHLSGLRVSGLSGAYSRRQKDYQHYASRFLV